MYKYLITYFVNSQKYEKTIMADDHMKAIKAIGVNRDDVFEIRLIK